MDPFHSDIEKALRYSASERAAFESAIDKEPLEASNHLVYSDWLTEHGEHDEAAFRKSMGEWVKTESAHQTLIQWHPYFAGDDHPRPYQVTPSQELPTGVEYGKLNPAIGDPRHPLLDETDTKGMRPFATPGYGTYIAWPSYRAMEGDFRKAFQAGRKSPPQES
jgi:uncharacterized protein (TIGR02996 family)